MTHYLTKEPKSYLRSKTPVLASFGSWVAMAQPNTLRTFHPPCLVDSVYYYWGEDKILEFVFRRCQCLRFYVFPTKSAKISLELNSWCIQISVADFSPYGRVEIVDFVIFIQLVVDFQTRLEKIIKQLKLLRFPVKRGYRCDWWLWQLEYLVNTVLKTCTVAVICQLLKSEQKLVCFNRRSRVFTAEFQFICRTIFFCLPGYVAGEQHVTSSWTPVSMS